MNTNKNSDDTLVQTVRKVVLAVLKDEPTLRLQGVKLLLNHSN